MKLDKIFLLGLAATGLLTTSCADLNTEPAGAVTGDQYSEAVTSDPSKLASVVGSMFFQIGKEYNVYGQTSGRADDFGWPAQCLAEGTNAGDMVSQVSGYNWFSVACNYSDRNIGYANPYIRWSIFYNQIKACNDLLNMIKSPSTTTLKQDWALAKALRAWDYLELVQQYAFTYKGHENDPSIPIYLSDNEEGHDTISSKRQSVSFVYSLIEKDLTEAASELDGYTRPNKSYINQSVVYGLLARMALTKQDWPNAATYAQKAIDLASTDGVTPASISAMSKVGSMFYSKDETNWMWGLSFDLSNIYTDGQYETWVSQISSLASNSYTTETGCYRCINSHLWNTIPSTDVRKGWWVDSVCKSPLIKGLTWTNSGETASLGTGCGNLLDYMPYTNVKFGCYQGTLGTTNTCGDFPMMRVEEMYLILAEAQGRQNETTGAKTLEDFIKKYRDPSYTYASRPISNFVDEIWRQRRIELWGEGFAMGDILRLNKPMVRFLGSTDVVTNWPASYQFNLPANDKTLLMRINQSEINGNPDIDDEDNNTLGTVPSKGLNPALRDGVTDNY